MTRILNIHELLEFLGKLLGKGLREGILVELPLAWFFIKKFLKGGTCDGLVFSKFHFGAGEWYRTVWYRGETRQVSLSCS